MNIAVRGFAGSRKIFEERFETEATNLEKLAEEHIVRMLSYPMHMLEIEFLDEPDPLQRFFRFGTDPRAMVMPAPIGKDKVD